MKTQKTKQKKTQTKQNRSLSISSTFAGSEKRKIRKKQGENMYYKIPIIEKVYEAYSTIADDRIRFEENKFLVYSSDYSKFYIITKYNDTYISNDKMSFWNKTIGYPILAIMMLNGEIAYNKEIALYFKDINWKKLNTEYNNDYVKTGQIILDNLKNQKIDVQKIIEETEKVYSQIKELKIEYIKSKIFPPK